MALGDPCFGKTFDRLKAENEELRAELEQNRRLVGELRSTAANRVIAMRLLFHRLWTMARASPDYEKEPWKEMEKLLW